MVLLLQVVGLITPHEEAFFSDLYTFLSKEISHQLNVRNDTVRP